MILLGNSDQRLKFMGPPGESQVHVGISSIDTRQKQAATCQHISFSFVTILGYF